MGGDCICPPAGPSGALGGGFDAFHKTRRNVLALHERKSRVLLACRLESKAAGPIAEMMMELFGGLPKEMRRTVSFDNGVEFSHHHRLNPMGTDTYFCDAHSPWQKGGVENAIGRMRRFFPSKTDLAKIPNKRFNDLIGAYNNTPRKCLDYQTPREVFLQQLLHFNCESTSRLFYAPSASGNAHGLVCAAAFS